MEKNTILETAPSLCQQPDRTSPDLPHSSSGAGGSGLRWPYGDCGEYYALELPEVGPLPIADMGDEIAAALRAEGF